MYINNIVKKLYRKDSNGKWLHILTVKGDKANKALLEDYVYKHYGYSHIKAIRHSSKAARDGICATVTVYYSNDNKAVYYL